jgi:hypothetical protein
MSRKRKAPPLQFAGRASGSIPFDRLSDHLSPACGDQMSTMWFLQAFPAVKSDPVASWLHSRVRQIHCLREEKLRLLSAIASHFRPRDRL